MHYIIHQFSHNDYIDLIEIHLHIGYNYQNQKYHCIQSNYYNMFLHIQNPNLSINNYNSHYEECNYYKKYLLFFLSNIPLGTQ